MEAVLVVQSLNGSSVDTAIWIRCSLVLASAIVLFLISLAAARGSRRAWIRLRIISVISPDRRDRDRLDPRIPARLGAPRAGGLRRARAACGDPAEPAAHRRPVPGCAAQPKRVGSARGRSPLADRSRGQFVPGAGDTRRVHGGHPVGRVGTADSRTDPVRGLRRLGTGVSSLPSELGRPARGDRRLHHRCHCDQSGSRPVRRMVRISHHRDLHVRVLPGRMAMGTGGRRRDRGDRGPRAELELLAHVSDRCRGGRGRDRGEHHCHVRAVVGLARRRAGHPARRGRGRAIAARARDPRHAGAGLRGDRDAVAGRRADPGRQRAPAPHPRRAGARPGRPRGSAALRTGASPGGSRRRWPAGGRRERGPQLVGSHRHPYRSSNKRPGSRPVNRGRGRLAPDCPGGSGKRRAACRCAPRRTRAELRRATGRDSRSATTAGDSIRRPANRAATAGAASA